MIVPPPPPVCPSDTVKVTRLFNKATINHRYVPKACSRMLLTQDWANEGPDGSARQNMMNDPVM